MSESAGPQWFVMNAYGKNERRAEEALRGVDGLPYFIPKRYALRTYHGKHRRELVPAIPNLIFVHASYEEVEALQKRYSYIGYATTKENGRRKILKVSDREMAEFIEIAKHYEEDLVYYRPEEIDLTKGTRVRIVGGPFTGAVGTLLKVKGKRSRRLVVKLQDVIAIAAAYIEPEYIQVAEE